MRIIAWSVALVFAFGLVSVPPGVAEPDAAHEYYGGMDCALLQDLKNNDCRYSCDIWWPPQFQPGAVCMPPGHIGFSDDGVGTVTIVDDVIGDVAGYICQDTDEDGLCGGAGELEWTFCGSFIIRQEDGWDLAHGFMVAPYGPVTGIVGEVDPLLGHPCGLNVAMATSGVVTHS